MTCSVPSLPSPPPSLPFTHSAPATRGLLAVPPTYQAEFCLRAFALEHSPSSLTWAPTSLWVKALVLFMAHKALHNLSPRAMRSTEGCGQRSGGTCLRCSQRAGALWCPLRGGHTMGNEGGSWGLGQSKLRWSRQAIIICHNSILSYRGATGI